MEDQKILKNIIKWWENKRLLYNILVVLTTIFCYLKFNDSRFTIIDGIAIFSGIILSNFFYSFGTILEILDLYYINGKAKLYRFRLPFYILGTFIICYLIFAIILYRYMKPFQ